MSVPVAAPASLDLFAARAALFVAHTAHELRLHAWLRRVRPHVHILTPGARSGVDNARFKASAAGIAAAGAKQGAVFGAVLDRDLYAAVMDADAALFHRKTDALTQSLIAQEAELVVVDAWQYYNVAHDLAHLMGRVAADEAADALGRPITVLEYPVVHESLAPHAPASAPAGHLRLTAQEAARKLEDARAFPDIATELAELIGAEGEEGLAVEHFNHPPPLRALVTKPARKPEYERYGEARVAAGLYSHVLRWRHVEPIARSLGDRRPGLMAPSSPEMPARAG